MKLLLLHGPNLGRLGERPGDVPGVTLGAIEAAVREEAARHGPVDVRALQSNHEGALLDALQAAHAWADGVVLNAGGLAATSWVLREAVACAGVPVVEVTLDVAEGSVAGPTKSLLEDVVVARTSGRGLQGYVEAVRWIEGQLPASAPGGASPGGASPGGASPGGVSPGGVSPGGVSAGRARAGHQVVPVRPATTPRACAFCAEEPCELHAGATVLPARTVGLGLAGEAMMRLRALESNALLAETDESIAALLGGARTAEERFDAALGLSDGDGGPGVDDTTAQLPRSRAPVAGERGEAMPPIPKSLGPGAEGGLVRKSIGPGAAAPRKTLGRAVPEATNTAEGKDSGAPSRSQLARRISDHLSGALSASELAAFARTGWMALDDGAQFPAGERALLEPALRQLMFHDRPGASLDAPALISLLASLQ